MAPKSRVKRKKDGSERISWSLEMEIYLLDLWEENISGLRGPRKNSHIYREMAERMLKFGKQVRWNDVKSKIDNLTRKYRVEKQKVGPSTWNHFQKLDSILGSFKPFDIENVMIESKDLLCILEDESTNAFANSPTNTSSDDDDDIPCPSDSIDAPPPVKKLRKQMENQYEERMLELAEERTKCIAALAADTMKFHAKMLKLFREYLNKEK